MYGLNNGIPVGLRAVPSFGIARQNQLTAAIQSLFWDGSQGWWYDDDDTSTLFQDSAGTTPVTAVEQFVGLQLDKSRGLVLGPTVISNGNFSNGTTGWIADSGCTLSASGGVLTVTTTADSAFATQQNNVYVVNKAYQVTFTYSVNNTTTARLRSGATVLWSETGSLTTKTVTAIVFPTTTTFEFGVTGGTVTEFYISNISVRELPGNHRYAPASGNRPVWSKRVNLLEKTEQFDDAYWTKTRSSITANATTAPDGTLTADKLVENTDTNTHFVLRTTTVVATVAYTFSVYAKADTRDFIQIRYENAGGAQFYAANVNLVTGSFTNASFGSPTGTATSVTNAGGGWWRIAISVNADNTSFVGVFFPQAVQGTNSYTGDGTSGIFIWGADLRPANQATGTIPLYQRVNTSTDYDTNGFPGYLKADGIDDFLVTNSIDFSAGPTNPPLGSNIRSTGAIGTAGTPGGTPTYNTLTGDASLTRVDGSNVSFVTFAGTASKTYEVVIQNTSVNGITVRSGSDVVASIAGNTTSRVVITVGSGLSLSIWPAVNGATHTFTVTSVREITNANLGADKVTLCAGVRKLSDAAFGVVTELSTAINTNAGSFMLSAPQSASTTIAFNSRGSAAAVAIDATIAAPITRVVTGIGQISTDTCLLRLNGAQVASATTDQGTGNYGNYPAYFFRRAGTSFPFNGYEYSNIAVGKLLTADQLASLEQYMNEKTRAY